MARRIAQRPFAPKPTDPGAEVVWRQLLPVDLAATACEGCGRIPREWHLLAAYGQIQCPSCFAKQSRTVEVERSGQVWSKSATPAGFFVVPFERLDGEQVVELRQGKNDTEPRYVGTVYSANARVVVKEAHAA